MLLLSVETTSSVGSLELHDGTKSLINKVWTREGQGGSHSEWVTAALDEGLSSCQLPVNKINKIAVSLGPGSFTGIRVGINFVKTLAYSLNIPVVCYNSLLVLANSHPAEGSPLLVMLNAFRNMAYAGVYKYGEIWQEVIEPQALSIENLNNLIAGPMVCIGDGWPIFQSGLSARAKKFINYREEAIHHPRACDLTKLTLLNPSLGRTLVWNEIVPIYLRDSSAEEKQKEGLLRPINHLK